MSPNGDSCRRNSRLGAACIALSALLAVACIALLAQPRRYTATARVLLAPEAREHRSALAARARAWDISVRANGESRVLSMQSTSSDPRSASFRVNRFLGTVAREKSGAVRVIDEASVPYVPRRRASALERTLLAASLSLLSLGILFTKKRGHGARRRPSLPRSTVRAALSLGRAGRSPLLVQTRSGFRLFEGAAALARRSQVHVIGAVAEGSVTVAHARRRPRRLS